MSSLWYKDAVIYQAHVRAFLDSTSDGVGDFRRPDRASSTYLEGLGIDTLWLLPFYPSPLEDDGYDIADYENIHPAYGTLAGLRPLHRGSAAAASIRVITELVINHTSDQHPWFQAARQAPAGIAGARLLRLERHQPEVSGRPDHLLGHREVELDLGRNGRRLLLAPVLSSPAGPELRQPGGARRRRASHALLARSRRRRHAARCRALPYRARGDAVRQPRRDARHPQAHSRRDGRAATRTGCSSRRQTSGRPK